MLCAGLSEERSLQNCAAPQWSHGKSGSKEHNHFKGPLEENYQSKRMKERLLTQDKGGAAPRKMPAELGMLPWGNWSLNSPGRVPRAEGG